MPSGTNNTTSAVTGARRRLKLLLFVLVFFMSWAAYTFYDQYEHMNNRRHELREMNQLLTGAKADIERLQHEVVRLNDPEYIGQIARKEQGLGLPGEIPMHIDKTNP